MRIVNQDESHKNESIPFENSTTALSDDMEANS